MAATGRKLKAGGSHADAPTPKIGKETVEDEPEEEEEDEDNEEDVKDMFKKMMKEMRKVTGKVDKVAGIAMEAKQAAEEAKTAVAGIETEMKHMKLEVKESKALAVATGEEVATMKKDIDQLKHGGSKNQEFKVHAMSNGAGKEDEKQRTLTFGNFQEDTKNEHIIDVIKEKVDAVKQDLDQNGIFAFGKRFATRGAARFKTEDAMLSFLRRDDTKVNFVVDGHRIYMNRDIRKSPDEEGRNKAVRKLVRAIIEEEGGDGKITKENIDADYHKGIVRYKGIRVGEYLAGTMDLKGEAIKLRPRFDELMA